LLNGTSSSLIVSRAIVCTYGGALYRRILDSALGALLRVEFTTQGNEVLDFAVVLLLETEEGMETVRVYDAAHGHNEMHRYTRSGGKEPGEIFHSGTLGEGMRAAISEVERGYREMIEGWKSQ
jgi:hypothetical protein